MSSEPPKVNNVCGVLLVQTADTFVFGTDDGIVLSVQIDPDLTLMDVDSCFIESYETKPAEFDIRGIAAIRYVVELHQFAWQSMRGLWLGWDGVRKRWLRKRDV
jgi:hypothetical protein